MKSKALTTNGMRFIITIFILCLFLNCCNNNDYQFEESEEIITNQTIYKNEKEYCAFCDIIYYSGKYYIAFRVGPTHEPLSENEKNGYIKIMSSLDCKKWTEELIIVDDEWDLRDPCFCINENINELNLSYGLYNYNNPNPPKKNERVVLSFINGKLNIKEKERINIGIYSHYWLWKIYYHEKKYWSVGYYENENPILVSSENGIDYEKISEIPINGNETALIFIDNTIYTITRNANFTANAYCSYSEPPYLTWNIESLNKMIHSPEILKINKKIYLACRNEFGVSLYLLDLSSKAIGEFINLFAKANTVGDRGYPGMVLVNNILHVVYYACNDYVKYPSIYLTNIKIN